MAIDFKPFNELFAPAYQLTYISTDGHINVGPNTYSVFHAYTMAERQQIFQVCEKYLPWEFTQKQEQWEKTQYMYQFIIKSPPPFPYEEYPLSEDIIMAITYPVDCTTPGDRLEWLTRAKELTKRIHNAFNVWHRNGLTLTQYNKFPQKVKNNFSYATKISDSEWDRFNQDFLEPLNSKICNQLGIQRAAGNISTRWIVKIEDI